jgi:hypothetical protein
MLLILHIIVALTSLVFTGIVFISPSKPKMQISYTLVALTLISGGALILSKPAPITQTCISGLTYLAFVSVGIFFAQKKLAKITIK